MPVPVNYVLKGEHNSISTLGSSSSIKFPFIKQVEMK